MPRLTRAQLRAQEAEIASYQIHEDTATGSASSPNDYDPFSTEVSTRPPLQEVHSNSTPVTEKCQAQRAMYDSNAGESEIAMHLKEPKVDLVSANDENITPASAQCPSGEKAGINVIVGGEAPDNEIKDERENQRFRANILTPRKPLVESHVSRTPSKVSIVASESTTQTPKFDPAIHLETQSEVRTPRRNDEDSFVASIKPKTPTTMMNTQETEGSAGDSFVGHTTKNSTSKHAVRIEDSVEAMDALEEAIEQVSQELPKTVALDPQAEAKLSSPYAVTALQSPTITSEIDEAHIPTGDDRSVKDSAPIESPRSVKSTPRLSLTRAPRRISGASAGKFSRVSLTSTVSARPRQSAITTVAAIHANSGRRKNSTVLSTSKAPFVPSKSTKPPTISTFKLPGEAISARMKAQREERLKQQEAETEATRKRTEFKARPLPHASGMVSKRQGNSTTPRENSASRARTSLMAARKESGNANAAPITKQITNGSLNLRRVALSVARDSMTPSATTQPGLAVQKIRKSSPAIMGVRPVSKAKKAGSTLPANYSAVRRNVQAQSGLPSALGTPAGSEEAGLLSVTAEPKEVGSNIKPVSGTIKGKVVFNRPKLASDELLRQKREKEQAAGKARAEAAQKGRLASREWAAKQAQRKEEEIVRKLVEAKDKPAGGSILGEG